MDKFSNNSRNDTEHREPRVQFKFKRHRGQELQRARISTKTFGEHNYWMQVPRNITGLVWHIDNNVLTHEQSTDLFKMAELGWLTLGISSRIEVEHLDAKSQAKKDFLAEKRKPFLVSFAPMNLGHSLLGTSVLAASQDENRLKNVYKAMWPKSDFMSDQSQQETRTMGRSRLRDSLLVSDAIRYGATAFVTHDLGILEASERIRMAFGAFDVLSIEAATLLARSRIAKSRKYKQLRGTGYLWQELPEWP